eukprot:2145554-Rhodomonas_salina.3
MGPPQPSPGRTRRSVSIGRGAAGAFAVQCAAGRWVLVVDVGLHLQGRCRDLLYVLLLFPITCQASGFTPVSGARSLLVETVWFATPRHDAQTTATRTSASTITTTGKKSCRRHQDHEQKQAQENKHEQQPYPKQDDNDESDDHHDAASSDLLHGLLVQLEPPLLLELSAPLLHQQLERALDLV